jgi:hypothetical protein
VDIWTYFAQREAEARDLSLGWDGDFWDMVAAEADNQRGRLFGTFVLMERAFLAVSESVVVQGSHIHREDYAYYLIIQGEEIWGEERDPTHSPAVHRHSYGHVTEDSEPISFRAAAEKAWDEISRRMSEG